MAMASADDNTTTLASTAPTALGTGWLGSDLVDHEERWRVPLPCDVVEELTDAAAEARWRGERPDLSAPRPRALPRAQTFASEVRDRLGHGLGLVVLTGFPVDAAEPVEIELAYWTLGLMLGRPVSQSAKGDLLGRVEDRGSDIASPVQRGYESSAALPFHVDRTDLIGLLCVSPARSGGLSRIVSSAMVHDLLLAESPELAALLYEPFPNDRRGEEQPGESPWCDIPVFSRVDTSFACRYVRRFIEGSQRHDAAPRLTEGQRAAMDALDAVLERPGVSLDMQLRPGDLQLINNFHILHARTAFTDGDGGRGRLLLRLWLAFAESPELPAHYRPLYGATASGSYRGGVWPAAAVPRTIGRQVDDLG
jgi:hypothetical protein